MIIHVATYEPEVEYNKLCALLHGQYCCVYQQLILKVQVINKFKVISNETKRKLKLL